MQMIFLTNDYDNRLILFILYKFDNELIIVVRQASF